MKAWRWVAGCALTGYLVGVPFLHLTGPNYHHLVVHVAVVHHTAPYVNNPYLPLQPPPKMSTAPPASATSGKGKGHVSPYMLAHLAHRAAHPSGFMWPQRHPFRWTSSRIRHPFRY